MWLAFGDQSHGFRLSDPAYSRLTAPALHPSRSVAKFGTGCPNSGTGKFTGKSEVSDCDTRWFDASPILVVRMRRPLAGRDLTHLLVSDYLNLQALPSLIIDMNASSFDEALS
jgi:hypothetical protein